ncbi:hypothetical protein BX666DRAFT_147164 [Dichotomocladium elegans]|nr:hypothetical protein BX666DRAFT_147164 [Dichotomocladium elegans]
MANLSSLPSASHQRPPSAFQWPPVSSELSIKEILDDYNHDPELLKVVLSAKAEEDKKLAARNTLQIEEARIQQRKMDLETLRMYYNNINHQPPASLPAPHFPPPPSLPQPPLPSSSTFTSYYSCYVPHHPPPQQRQQQQQQQLQQQPPGAAVGARASGKEATIFSPIPRSYYYQGPHSAHPLSSTLTTNGSQSKKRTRTAGGGGAEDEKVSHEQVMEALKAKLQRGEAKRARTLPKPLVNPSMHSQSSSSSSTSSATATTAIPSTPRSAKPILPPIDTSVGRLQHQQQGTSSSSGPLTSPYGGPRLPPFSAAIADLTPSSSTTSTATDDPKRRVRSLSPLPFAIHNRRK